MDPENGCFVKPEIKMQRRKFCRELFKLVRDCGMSSIHASRDLYVHENVLRKWIGEFGSDPVQAFQTTGNESPNCRRSNA
jgi:transposase